MVSPAIDIKSLRVAYGETVVLDGIDVQVAPSEIAIVVGGSGCGKSSLLKTVIGLVQPDAGQIEVLGQDSALLDEQARAALNKRLGVMFQYGALLNSLTIGQNIALPLEMHSDLEPALSRILCALASD
jgi:phospholipid/cholesterol/gamma-HCH transport system ATP-binding protein